MQDYQAWIHNFALGSSFSDSSFASQAIFPKKSNIARLSAFASAELAWPNVARAAIPCTIIANLNIIHDLTHLTRSALFPPPYYVATHPIPLIGQLQTSFSPPCHLFPSFIPSTHHLSNSSRSGKPVSSLLSPFNPIINVESAFDSCSSFTSTGSRTGGNENARRRLPRSARGEPSVQSSQSSIPITLDSVGWKIWNPSQISEGYPTAAGVKGTYEIINLIIPMNNPSNTTLYFSPRDLLPSLLKEPFQLPSPPYLPYFLSTLFRPRPGLRFRYPQQRTHLSWEIRFLPW
jgi:hypothetical protein